jgi:hypothetical protein
MPTRTITLIDHDQIRRWAEARGGKPSTVLRTARKNDPGILRIDFPGYSGEGSLAEIEWDEFFEKFEAANLALIVQEKTVRGQKSNFNKLVQRETIQRGRRSVSAKKKSTAKRTVRARTAPKRTAPKKKATTARPKARTVRATRTTRTKKATARRSPSRGRRTSTRR